MHDVRYRTVRTCSGRHVVLLVLDVLLEVDGFFDLIRIRRPTVLARYEYK